MITIGADDQMKLSMIREAISKHGIGKLVIFVLIDIPHRHIDMNDFLKRCKPRRVTFLSTGLPVDEYYFGHLTRWFGRLEAFYAQAGLYLEDR